MMEALVGLNHVNFIPAGSTSNQRVTSAASLKAKSQSCRKRGNP